MAIIDEKKVNMNVLKTMVKALNESGLLPEAIPIKGKKMVLAAAFVKGLEVCNEIGKLDEVADDIFNYYNEIVPPPEAAGVEAAPAAATPAPAAATPAPAATGRGRTTRGATAPAATPARKPAAAKAAAPAAAPKATRADVFAELLTHKTAYTKEQLAEKMLAKYGGSEAEANFQIGQMTRTVLALAGVGLMHAEINDKKQLVIG